MHTKSKALEDIAKAGLGGLSLIKGIKDEVKRGLRTTLAVNDKNNDILSREEFSVFSKIIQECKIKIIDLESRIAELENEKK